MPRIQHAPPPSLYSTSSADRQQTIDDKADAKAREVSGNKSKGFPSFAFSNKNENIENCCVLVELDIALDTENMTFLSAKSSSCSLHHLHSQL